MYEKAIIVALFVGVVAAGTLVAAIGIATQAHAISTCAGQEKDTKTCRNTREIRSSDEIDKRVASPPPPRT
jgi:hypothetical protein